VRWDPKCDPIESMVSK